MKSVGLEVYGGFVVSGANIDAHNGDNPGPHAGTNYFIGNHFGYNIVGYVHDVFASYF